MAHRDVHVAKAASLARSILPLVSGKGLEIPPPSENERTRERERTLSSQIAVEVKLVAQPVGTGAPWTNLLIPCHRCRAGLDERR